VLAVSAISSANNKTHLAYGLSIPTQSTNAVRNRGLRNTLEGCRLLRARYSAYRIQRLSKHLRVERCALGVAGQFSLSGHNSRIKGLK